MVEILSDQPNRTAQQVNDDLERLLAGVGESAPMLQVVFSTIDFELLRGLAGKPGVILVRDFPGLTKALKMRVGLDPEYHGPPRIVRELGTETFDDLAEQKRRDDLRKIHTWRENDARLRRGIDGRPLA